MLASTKVLLALTLSPALASPVLLVKVTGIPLPGVMVTMVMALITLLPATEEVRVSVQLPVASTVLQEGAPRLPVPLTTLKVITVPAGALTKSEERRAGKGRGSRGAPPQ